MKLKNYMLAGILLMTLSACAAAGGETGTMGARETAEVSAETRAAVDVQQLASAVTEKLSQADGKAQELLETIREKAGDAQDSAHIDTLKQYAEALQGFAAPQGEEFDDAELERIIAVYEALRSDQKQYMLDYNAGRMDVGDVQIVSNDNIYQGDLDLDEVESLNCVIQNNYRKDKENQLWIVSRSEDVVLFRQKKDASGNYPVTDAVFAEEGEQFLPSLKNILSSVGQEESLDEALESIEYSRVFVLIDMKDYLTEHPEIKGLEYEGEIRNAEELDAILDAKIDELAEAEVQETTEEAGNHPPKLIYMEHSHI